MSPDPDSPIQSRDGLGEATSNPVPLVDMIGVEESHIMAKVDTSVAPDQGNKILEVAKEEMGQSSSQLESTLAT